jgi:hypothetical protein
LPVPEAISSGMILALRRVACIGVLLALGVTVEGRVGETREALEARLLAAEGARAYPRSANEAKMRDMPYVGMMRLFPAELELVVYHKTADGTRASAMKMRDERFPAGWDFHVFYARGVSVLEVYRRNGADLSAAEVERLLAVNRDGEAWRRGSPNDEKPSAFGFAFEREDGTVRARQQGPHLLVFLTTLDAMLAKQLAEERRKREESQREAAPDSVSGF